MEVRGQLHVPDALLRWKEAQYPLNTRLAVSQSRSGRRKDIKSFPYRHSNSEPSAFQPEASYYTDCIIVVLLLLLSGPSSCVAYKEGALDRTLDLLTHSANNTLD
jgi:hypothetical protein